MFRFAVDLWREEDGGLSYEWTVVLTVLIVGMVAGLTAARDAIIDEVGDAAQAMVALDGSFVIDQPLRIDIDPDGAGPALPAQVGGGSDSAFTDRAIFTDCGRSAVSGQAALADTDS